MSLKEQTIKELQALGKEEIREVYNFIRSLKESAEDRKQKNTDYQKVREALKNVQGSLSDDILRDRRDRL
jgi:hypothetical protein